MKSIVRVVKKAARKFQAESVQPVMKDQNRWSKAVRSWVNEYEQKAREEPLPAFDRLFKNAA